MKRLHHVVKNRKKRIVVRTGFFGATLGALLLGYHFFGEHVTATATIVATFLHLGNFVDEIAG